MWMDTDGFPTRVWEHDPFDYVISNNLVVLFDNFAGSAGAAGSHIQDRIDAVFNKTICKLSVGPDGFFRTKLGNIRNCRNRFGLVHGFFHVTDLDFYREVDRVYNFFEIYIGDCYLCRNYDDQAAMTIPAAILAPNRSKDMRVSGLNMSVYHNYRMDGKEPAGGFIRYWKNHGKTDFPEAHGICPIKAAGRR